MNINRYDIGVVTGYALVSIGFVGSIGSLILFGVTDNFIVGTLSYLGGFCISALCIVGGAQMIANCKKASKNADWNRKMQLAEEADSKRRSEFAHQREVTLNNNL